MLQICYTHIFTKGCLELNTLVIRATFWMSQNSSSRFLFQLNHLLFKFIVPMFMHHWTYGENDTLFIWGWCSGHIGKYGCPYFSTKHALLQWKKQCLDMLSPIRALVSYQTAAALMVRPATMPRVCLAWLQKFFFLHPSSYFCCSWLLPYMWVGCCRHNPLAAQLCFNFQAFQLGSKLIQTQMN